MGPWARAYAYTVSYRITVRRGRAVHGTVSRPYGGVAAPTFCFWPASGHNHIHDNLKLHCFWTMMHILKNIKCGEPLNIMMVRIVLGSYHQL